MRLGLLHSSFVPVLCRRPTTYRWPRHFYIIHCSAEASTFVCGRREAWRPKTNFVNWQANCATWLVLWPRIRISSADLRRVLRFLTKVLEVVDQSFQDVYGLLIDIQFLTPALVGSGRVEQLQVDLQNVFSRSRFRDAEEICSRLHHLGETYQQSIRPIVEPLEASQQWYQVFFLLNEHEGRIIRMIQDAVYELRGILDADLSGQNLSSLKRKAQEKAESLRESLSDL